MAFHVIIAAPGLTVEQRHQAALSGPPAVLTRDDHTTMLRDAGFCDIEETDVTSAYRTSLRDLLDWSAKRRDDLRAVLGDDVFEERQNDRRVQLTAVDRGLLRRSMLVARTD